jgi:ATP-binding cassette subfamily C protein
MQRKLQSIFPKSIILRCLNILKKRERQKLFILAVFQVLANIFDLIGVALAGLLGVITISGFGVNSPSPRVQEFILIIGLEKSSFQVQVGVLALLTATILILRTIFSIYIMKRTYLFLSEYGATLSKDTIKKLLEQPMVFITKKSSQETVFAITRGIDAITVGVLGTCVSIISDLSLLVIFGLAVLVVDPIIAFGTMAL